MAHITDLTEVGDSHELLTDTSVNRRVFGSISLLSTDPLETYLDADEQPRYVLRNGKFGVRVERDAGAETDHVRPGSDFRALALVTDLRVLVVVGQEDGDEQFDIRLADVVEAKARSVGFRTSALVVNTVDDEQWRFDCKGDVTPVASTIDDLAGVWTLALRLLDEADDQISSAEAALAESGPDRARVELGDAQSKIRRGVTRIREVGPAATERVESRARSVTRRLRDLERGMAASKGARAHARAQESWSQQAYEDAATRYERAIEAYETALAADGSTPAEETLERRLAGAVRERELLRVGPLVDADAARRRATEEQDAEEAARWWERALDGYRELLTLDWGTETREFVVDRDTIRDQTVSVADDAIDDHLEAGRGWLRSGDRLAVDGNEKLAREVYQRAHSEFENAKQLATEVRPRRLDDVEPLLDQAAARLDGDLPDEAPGQSAVGSPGVEAGGRRVGRDSTGGSTTAGGETSGVPDATGEPDATADDDRATGETGGDGALIDQLRARKRE